LAAAGDPAPQSAYEDGCRGGVRPPSAVVAGLVD